MTTTAPLSWQVLAEPQVESAMTDQTVAKVPSPRWGPRYIKAAEWLATDPAVVDVGCGQRDLERYLMPGTKYVAIDLRVPKITERVSEAQRDATLVVDFNREVVPDVGIASAAALGVMEYMNDPPAFVARLNSLFGHLVISYNVGVSRSMDRRVGLGWVNSMTLNEVEELLCAASYRINNREQLNARQYMWDVRRADR